MRHQNILSVNRKFGKVSGLGSHHTVIRTRSPQYHIPYIWYETLIAIARSDHTSRSRQSDRALQSGSVRSRITLEHFRTYACDREAITYVRSSSGNYFLSSRITYDSVLSCRHDHCIPALNGKLTILHQL